MLQTLNTTATYSSLLFNCLHQLACNNSAQSAIQFCIDAITEHTNTNYGTILKKSGVQGVFETSFSTNADLTLQKITFDLVPELTYALDNNELINILPSSERSPYLQKQMEAFQWQQIFICPLNYQNENIGFLFLAAEKETIIPENLINEINQILLAIANALQQDFLVSRLFYQNEIFETTLQTLHQLIWEYNLSSKTLKTIGFIPGLEFIDSANFNLKEFVEQYIHPQDAPTVTQQFNQFILGIHRSSGEITFRILVPREHRYIWVQSRFTLLKDVQTKDIIIVGTSTDISESKVAELQLEQQRAQFQFLVQNINQVTFTIDTGGCFSFISKSWEELTGYYAIESISQPLTNFLAEESKEKARLFLIELFSKQKSSAEIKLRLLLKNGNMLWVNIAAQSSINIEEKVEYIYGTLENIQQRHEAEIVLKESNEKLNSILNSSKEIILTLDLQEGIIENVNSAIGILGYNPNEWIGSYFAAWQTDVKSEIYELIKICSENENGANEKIYFTHFNTGEKIPFEVSSSIFNYKNKSYALYVLRDIREKEAYQKNIKSVTEQLAQLINNINDVYAIFNLQESQYEFVSDNVEGFYGTEKEIFVKKNLIWEEIVHIEDLANVREQVNQVIEHGGRAEIFYRITTPTGEQKLILSKINVLNDAFGKPHKAYIVTSDYTQLEKAEQSLFESERRFRFISENISDFIAILDKDGTINYASPSAQKVLGYQADEMIGLNIIHLIYSEDIEHYRTDLLEQSIFHQQEAQIRYRFKTKDNQLIWVETYAKPISSAAGEINTIITSTRDVTDREKLMADLKLALDKERELSELKSKFVSMASHQFRTPLTVILSGIDIMQMYTEALPELQQTKFNKQFAKIASEVNRLQDLMNDVLILGRADAQRTPFQPEPTNLLQFCTNIAEGYNARYPVERHILVHQQGIAQLVDIDVKLIGHALDNILSNAYKYSHSGNIELEIHYNFDDVAISISDYGMGIPKEDLNNLFQPFYRAGNTDEIQGTGLGLSIVKEFIDLHKGQIFVTSEINKGTKVTILLPLTRTNGNS